MKYFIYVLAFLLLSLMALAPLARASGVSIEVVVPTSFPLSGAATATDNGSSTFSPGPGSIDILRSDRALLIRVPATAARAGTTLASLDDPESGIGLRNDTMMLPIRGGGGRDGWLVATTDDLIADANGYSGLITGLEIDTPQLSAAREGVNFTAGAAILLRDLPAGADYRISFGDNATLAEAIAADLEPSGLAAMAMSPALEVAGARKTDGDAIGFVIATVKPAEDWSRRYGDKNVTFYCSPDGRLSRAAFSVLRTEDGGTAYQAMAPGAARFALVATGPFDRGTPAPAGGWPVDMLALGGALAVLVIALLAMVRRVMRR